MGHGEYFSEAGAWYGSITLSVELESKGHLVCCGNLVLVVKKQGGFNGHLMEAVFFLYLHRCCIYCISFHCGLLLDTGCLFYVGIL